MVWLFQFYLTWGERGNTVSSLTVKSCRKVVVFSKDLNSRQVKRSEQYGVWIIYILPRLTALIGWKLDHRDLIGGVGNIFMVLSLDRTKNDEIFQIAIQIYDQFIFNQSNRKFYYNLFVNIPLGIRG